MEFETRHCTPENPKANRIVERFMGVLVKIVHAAVAGGQDPKLEVRRRMLNYRNTPNPSTSKTLVELMIQTNQNETAEVDEADTRKGRQRG